jgi:hypothetical protein
MFPILLAYLCLVSAIKDYEDQWGTRHFKARRVELGYNVMKGTEYFVSLWTSVVITEEYNVMINSEELIGTTEYLTL